VDVRLGGVMERRACDDATPSRAAEEWACDCDDADGVAAASDVAGVDPVAAATATVSGSEGLPLDPGVLLLLLLLLPCGRVRDARSGVSVGTAGDVAATTRAGDVRPGAT
jgi:hypothetical protein